MLQLKWKIKECGIVGRRPEFVRIRYGSRTWQIIKLHCFRPNLREEAIQTCQSSAPSKIKQTRSPMITSRIRIIFSSAFGIGFVRKGVSVSVDTADSTPHICL